MSELLAYLLLILGSIMAVLGAYLYNKYQDEEKLKVSASMCAKSVGATYLLAAGIILVAIMLNLIFG